MKTIEEFYIDEYGVCPSIEKEVPLHSYYDLIAFAKKWHENELKNLQLGAVIGSKITQPYYIEVKIVTGGVLATNANFEIIKDFERHGFTFKDEPITQKNDDGIAWTFMMKNGGLLEG